METGVDRSLNGAARPAEAAHERLQGVHVERLDWKEFIARYDRPEVREMFAGFEVEEVETRYSANARAMRRAGEVLISGGRAASARAVQV